MVEINNYDLWENYIFAIVWWQTDLQTYRGTDPRFKMFRLSFLTETFNVSNNAMASGKSHFLHFQRAFISNQAGQRKPFQRIA